MKDQWTAYTEMKQEVMMMIGMIICEGGGKKGKMYTCITHSRSVTMPRESASCNSAKFEENEKMSKRINK